MRKLLIAAAVVTCGASLSADNWPHWRGPVAGGVSTESYHGNSSYLLALDKTSGLLYMAGDVGVITCVDAKTGERVWRERLGGVYTASPVAADGKIYLVGESGETLVLRAGRKPEVLARNAIEGRVLASPAICGGRLYIRTDDQVIAIGG